MFASLIKLIRNEDGATAIEYGLIAALIAVAAVTIMGTVGSNLTADNAGHGHDGRAQAPNLAGGGCRRAALGQSVAVFSVRAGTAAGRGGRRSVEAWAAPAGRRPLRRYPRVYRTVGRLGPEGDRRVPGRVSLPGNTRDRGAWRHRRQIRRRQCDGRVRRADCDTGGRR